MTVKAYEFVERIRLQDFIYKDKRNCIDHIFTGRADKEVTRAATCMVITPDVLRAAAAWGADIIVTHEPTFHNDNEDIGNFAPYAFKRELLARKDIAVCRWHDSPHYGKIDYVSNALVKRMGWKGSFDGRFTFIFDEPSSPLQIAKDIRDKMHIKHPRIAGRRDGEVKKVSLQLGQRGDVPYLALLENDVDLIIGGEVCEWEQIEPIRDMAQIGMQKTAIILGHVVSERDVMQDLADYINDTLQAEGVSARYFDCGDIYSDIED